MSSIPALPCSRMTALKAHREALIDHYKKQDAMIDGICNIILANQLTANDADELLKQVQNRLKYKFIYAKKR